MPLWKPCGEHPRGPRVDGHATVTRAPFLNSISNLVFCCMHVSVVFRFSFRLDFLPGIPRDFRAVFLSILSCALRAVRCVIVVMCMRCAHSSIAFELPGYSLSLFVWVVSFSRCLIGLCCGVPFCVAFVRIDVMRIRVPCSLVSSCFLSLAFPLILPVFLSLACVV